jgi:hypothetical protein
MSFSYNNQTWTPKGTNEHALDLLNNINAVLASNSITNLLKPLISNVIWIFCLAVGAKLAAKDQQLFQAQQSFNVSNCDDSQITNLMSIAGTSYIPGTYSKVVITATAASSGTCVIPASSVLPFINGVNFITDSDLTLSASASGTIPCTASQVGAIAVALNQLNSFSTVIPNLSSVTNNSIAVPGVANETATGARNRINLGQTITFTLDGLATALKSLDGINDAVVYFNTSASAALTLPGGISLAARKALMIILGTSSKIAETFLSRMIVETQGAQNQTYTTLSGQAFTVHYDNAATQNTYIKVYIPNGVTLTTAQIAAVKQVILDYQTSVKIGEVLSSVVIDDLYSNADLSGIEIDGSLISINGTNYYNRVAINANSYPVFDATRIIIENLA